MAERPEDLNLPNAVITRIIKEALPDGVNVSKEARRAISQAASVFVLYTTSCANNFALKAKRKTLNAGDVLAAMEEMEFERFMEPLREALEALCRSFTRSLRVVLGFLLTVLMIILTPWDEILRGAPDRGRLSVVL
ncbi:DNA polymerase epsilon subunit 3 isoform X3 [Nerophis ophidion]|uniref:DNA polymerase epsilon subunit 3 isoform X3 n=1 Tax=Nerophis ophidion TaxID=159077 RepID=UPI002ADF441E|nr:DNA polymerase epsilon subunit 3 isoform X3 [Nerophis ophidion]